MKILEPDVLLTPHCICTTVEQEATKCQKEYLAATKNPAPGRFTPRCKLDGSYADVQCKGSVCYCVDKDGNEIIGTKTPVASGKPVCKEPCMFNTLVLAWHVCTSLI